MTKKLVCSSDFIPPGYTTTPPSAVMRSGKYLLPRGIMIDPDSVNWSKINLEASRPSRPITPKIPVKLQFTVVKP